MGPKDISFFKIKPKAILLDDDEDIEVQSQWSKPHIPSQDAMDDYEEAPVIEEIKIKWNSFIKMKKRNYLQDY
jgi:hypothetical protein